MVDRYLRQTALEQVGIDGQRKLMRASAVVVGAGGLGSPILTYLVSAGVGRVGLIDADAVSASNLNRQFLHGEPDIGRLKVDSAVAKLAELNGEVELVAHRELLTGGNAARLLGGYDIILGAVDSYDTRQVINRAAVALGIPYVDGGVSGFCGNVAFSNPPATPCLACVFPGLSGENKPGVMGPTAGVVGSIEANLALLWLLGRGNAIENKLLMYDGLRMSVDLIGIRRDERCPVCGGGAV